MVNDRVYYVNLKPYIHDLPFEQMIERFIKSDIINIQVPNLTDNFKTNMLQFMKQYRHAYVEKTIEAQNIDKILSKKILQHIQIFFNKKSQNNTMRKLNKNHNITYNTTRKKKLHLP
jgi:hypothetical protein